MKPFWKKMFWWDAPAKGAFFALTLLLVGAYVLGSAFLLARELGWIERARLGVINHNSWPFLALFAILFFYYGILTLRFFFQANAGLSRYFSLPGFWIWLALLALQEIREYPSNGYILPLGMAVYFTIILPFSVCFGKHWIRAATSMAGWIVAVLMLWNSTVFFLFSFGTLPGMEGEVIPDTFPLLPLYELLGVSGYGGTLTWVGIAILALFGWYLLTGRLFAGLTGCRFRALFTRPVLVLLSVALAVYIAFTGMAWNEAGKVSQNIARLENRFGRPMTATALGELYFGQDRPDAEFWQRAEKLKTDSQYLFQFLDSPLMELSDADWQSWRDRLEQKKPGAAEWEELFSGSIPPIPREYRKGQLFSILIPNLRFIRKFNQIAMWRIRFFLADGRIADAVTAYRNMERVNRSLLREPHLLSGLVWLSAENLRLDVVEMLLESGKLTDKLLREISFGQEEVEGEIAPMQERSLYGEVVMELDLFDGMANGAAFQTTEEKIKVLNLNAIGIFFPQYRWGNLREKSELARHLNVADFSDIASYSCDMPMLCRTLLPALRCSSARFEELAARLRGMRALIAAERWKREHGEYPDTLPDLPEDPFTGKPLLYRKGESRIEVERANYNPETKYWDRLTEERTVPAVQVWSPAAGDDGPQNRTRAIRKL